MHNLSNIFFNISSFFVYSFVLLNINSLHSASVHTTSLPEGLTYNTKGLTKDIIYLECESDKNKKGDSPIIISLDKIQQEFIGYDFF